MTWQELTEAEPELLDLEAELQPIRDDGGASFCANRHWYIRHDDGRHSFKYRLCELVGWGALDERLRTSAAYDTAYRHLYDQLPDCRNCNRAYV